jgi:hypothetical protein
MIVRALDSNGDWSFGLGKQSYKSDMNALRQQIVTRLKSWKGDCFFALQDGVDWLNYLDIGTKSFLDLDIKRVILQTGGILRMRNYSSILAPDTRSVSISCTLDTIYGTMILSEVV